jgi:uncharacterized protein with HEPN domain
MAERRAIYRLYDVDTAIADIFDLLADKGFGDVVADRTIQRAFERNLEIISEASRHVPAEFRAAHPELPWADIATLGNILRHAYHKTDLTALWSIYETRQLSTLQDAVRAWLASHGNPLD